MLWRLHVKNFALIEEADIEFGAGLNILTGETGAGKSILIDAVTAALGGKVSATMIRTGASFAYIELVFLIEDEKKKQKLLELGIELEEEHTLIISRKIMKGRSLCKLNDETVTVARLKEVTSLLIDIHGQHEHQSLIYKSKHLQILDEYARIDLEQDKEKMSACYKEYKECKKKLESFTLKEDERMREVDFCKYEINEIESAALKEGEEEELEAKYRRASHAKSILEALSMSEHYLGYDSEYGAGENIGQALKVLTDVLRYDENLQNLVNQLSDVESILSDINHDLTSRIEDVEYEEAGFNELATRLDLIHSIYAKYGRNYEEVMNSLAQKRERLSELENYENSYKETKQKLESLKDEALGICEKISATRQKIAKKLAKEIENHLKELNFLQVQFDILVTRTKEFNENGYDEIEFVISTNPGEPMRAVASVASGGELSRIMLAIKTVLADSDEIPTLIFDEIDTGISGRTAQQVSEKLSYIGKNHQVLCITHLPQIAAMAKEHFLIEKNIVDGTTKTKITSLSEQDSIKELARLLGGVKITDAVLENAVEMKRLAMQSENY